MVCCPLRLAAQASDAKLRAFRRTTTTEPTILAPKVSPERTRARYFLEFVGDLDGDFVWLDFESYSKRHDPRKYCMTLNDGKDFIAAVSDKIGRLPFFYSGNTITEVMARLQNGAQREKDKQNQKTEVELKLREANGIKARGLMNYVHAVVSG
jgi:hypothetical protein